MAEKNGRIKTLFYIVLAGMTLIGTVCGAIYGAAQLVGTVRDNCKTVENHETRVKVNEEFRIETKKDIAYLKQDAEAQKKDRNEMMNMQRAILNKLEG